MKKTGNRFLAMLLTVLLLFSMFPFAVTAVEIVDSGSCGENVTWTLDGNGTLTISGMGDMDNDVYFYRKGNIKTVIIEPGVTSIGDGAFFNCTGLTSVTIPDSVTRIGYSAFEGCTGLTSVTIPDSVTSIGDSAFFYCTGLTSVTISDSVTSIGRAAFSVCAGLTSVTIGNSVTSIGVSAFAGCEGLTSVTIPDSVTSIGGGAFRGCTGLTSVTIPDSVTSIGYVAFYGCDLLTDVYYSGSEAQWSRIAIKSANDPLLSATIHYSYIPHDHIWDNGEITTPATCKDEGVKTFTCTVCGETKTEPIPATGVHTWNDGKVTKEATVDEPGVKTFTCTVCGQTKTEEIPKLEKPAVPVINGEKAKEQGGSVFAAEGLAAGEFLTLAGEGASLTKADGTAVKPDEAVGSGMVLTKADGTKETVIVKGDNDGDGKVTTNDARNALRAAVGLDHPNAWQTAASLVVSDTAIQTADARGILRAAIGLDTLALV